MPKKEGARLHLAVKRQVVKLVLLIVTRRANNPHIDGIRPTHKRRISSTDRLIVIRSSRGEVGARNRANRLQQGGTSSVANIKLRIAARIVLRVGLGQCAEVVRIAAMEGDGLVEPSRGGVTTLALSEPAVLAFALSGGDGVERDARLLGSPCRIE